MNEKFLRALCVVLVFFAATALFAVTINQLGSALLNGSAIVEKQAMNEAVAACVKFEAPHAVIADGKAYCYTTSWGNEIVAPLDTLERLYGEKAPTPAAAQP